MVWHHSLVWKWSQAGKGMLGMCQDGQKRRSQTQHATFQRAEISMFTGDLLYSFRMMKLMWLIIGDDEIYLRPPPWFVAQIHSPFNRTSLRWRILCDEPPDSWQCRGESPINLICFVSRNPGISKELPPLKSDCLLDWGLIMIRFD